MLRILRNSAVLVGALGYFVDMFDLTLYGVVRTASLHSLGIENPKQILEYGIYINNFQMYGMLLGGFFWGILGDRKGRLSVLFGSIILYSLGNIANAFAWNITSYAVIRFFVGIGLAGELGTAITLVSESLSKEDRGFGTTFVASIGMLGGLAATVVGQHFSWQTSYGIGGVMGLALLFTRFNVKESGIYEHNKAKMKMGDLWLMLKPKFLIRYFACVSLGVPIWFITGILLNFAPEFARALQVEGTITAGNALMYGTIGLAAGDILSGLLSQLLKSRKKALGIFMGSAAILVYRYLNSNGATATSVYTLCFFLGLSAGYWAVFVTVAAEQFGTNIRATIATTVPNLVRGFLTVMATAFLFLIKNYSLPKSAGMIGITIITIAAISLLFMPETYGKDLDYLEA